MDLTVGKNYSIMMVEPTLFGDGKAQTVISAPGGDLMQYLSRIERNDDLFELFTHPYLLCSVVPAENAVEGYLSQLILLHRMEEHLHVLMLGRHGLLFQSTGRLYCLICMEEGEPVEALLDQVRNTVLCCEAALGCDVYAVASGVWEAGCHFGKTFFAVDEIWRYFGFIEDKPTVLYCPHGPSMDAGNISWRKHQPAHQKDMIAGFRRQDPVAVLEAGERMVTEVQQWGIPDVSRICFRVFQMLNALINEMLRQDLIGIQPLEAEAEHYRAFLGRIEGERELRMLVNHELSVLYQASLDYSTQKSDRLIQEIKGFIEQTLSDYNLSIDSVAEHFALSPEALVARFRQANQISVGEYIHVRRVERIKELLVTTDLTVEKIMEAAGYFSRSTMYRAFTRLAGMTPKDYRDAYGTK